MNLIRNIHSKIISKRPMNYTQFPQKDQHSTILKLLIFIRNNQLNNSRPKQKGFQLLILEDLTTIISQLVQFQIGNGYLARFDRKGFKDNCLKHPSGKNKRQAYQLHGIYQRFDHNKYPYNQSKIMAFQVEQYERNQNISGYEYNVKQCRKALQQCHKKSKEQSQKQFYQILLCLEYNLMQQQYISQPWRYLWTQLYIWTIKVFEGHNSEQQYAKMESRVNKALEKEIQSSKNKQISMKIIIISELVRAIVNIVFLKDSLNKQLLESAYKKYINLLNQKNHKSYNQIIQSVSILLLFQNCFEINKVQYNKKISQNAISRIKKEITELKGLGSSSQQDKIELQSYLLSPYQLTNFIKKNDLPFWKYQLSKSIKDQLAKNAIINLQPDYGKKKNHWKQVLLLLDPHDIRNIILSSPEKWYRNQNEQKPVEWIQAFFQLCKQNQEKDNVKFAQNIALAVGTDDTQRVKKDLNVYHDQWQKYNTCINRTNKRLTSQDLKELITFDFDLGQKFKNSCVFPQQLPDSFRQLCEKHIKLLCQQLNNKEQIDEKDLKFAFQPGFSNNMLRFSSSKWDEKWDQYWEKWTDLLFRNPTIMKDLIDIAPDSPEDEQQEQIYMNEESQQRA